MNHCLVARSAVIPLNFSSSSFFKNFVSKLLVADVWQFTNEAKLARAGKHQQLRTLVLIFLKDFNFCFFLRRRIWVRHWSCFLFLLTSSRSSSCKQLSEINSGSLWNFKFRIDLSQNIVTVSHEKYFSRTPLKLSTISDTDFFGFRKKWSNPESYIVSSEVLLLQGVFSANYTGYISSELTWDYLAFKMGQSRSMNHSEILNRFKILAKIILGTD